MCLEGKHLRTTTAKLLSISCRRITNFRSGSIPYRSVTCGSRSYSTRRISTCGRSPGLLQAGEVHARQAGRSVPAATPSGALRPLVLRSLASVGSHEGVSRANGADRVDARRQRSIRPSRKRHAPRPSVSTNRVAPNGESVAASSSGYRESFWPNRRPASCWFGNHRGTGGIPRGARRHRRQQRFTFLCGRMETSFHKTPGTPAECCRNHQPRACPGVAHHPLHARHLRLSNWGPGSLRP